MPQYRVEFENNLKKLAKNKEKRSEFPSSDLRCRRVATMTTRRRRNKDISCYTAAQIESDSSCRRTTYVPIDNFKRWLEETIFPGIKLSSDDLFYQHVISRYSPITEMIFLVSQIDSVVASPFAIIRARTNNPPMCTTTLAHSRYFTRRLSYLFLIFVTRCCNITYQYLQHTYIGTNSLPLTSPHM